MPVLLIYGISDEMADSLEELTDMLQRDISNIKELGLKKTDITCFYPKDLMKEGLGEEIIVFVDCLTKKPKRTKEVMDGLARVIIIDINIFFRDINLIECFIKPFDKANNGFSSMRKGEVFE